MLTQKVRSASPWNGFARIFLLHAKQELQILFPLTLYCWVTTICMSETIVTSLSLEEKLDTNQIRKKVTRMITTFFKKYELEQKKLN